MFGFVLFQAVELSAEENARGGDHPRTPSIGGGLPLLLLSVLPPVIPRASWPSAVQELPMRRNVTFSSEPKLDDQNSSRNRREPVIDLYNLCLRPERFNEKLTVLGRLKNLFGSRPSIRKSSASSYAGNSNVGIASALRSHMGYIAGLVPGSSKSQMASSCNTSATGINRLDGLYSRRQSFARAGGSGPIISITSDADDDEDPSDSRRKFSLAFCLKKDETDPKVNFALPLQKRKSITHQHSQPVLSFRERAKGSPRFPHRIMPTCSLTALEDRRKSSSVSSNPSRRSSQLPPTFNQSKKRKSVAHMGTKWRSMEDASTTVLPGSRRGSGVLALSCLPSSANPTGFKPRAASYSPNCDVWSTAEFGIPLSELAVKNNAQ